MLRLILILSGSVFISGVLVGKGQEGQSSAKPMAPCSQPASRQFDFWIGEWNVEWQLEGKTGKGTNVVRSTLDNCVIEEYFDGTPAIPLRGRSFSTYTKAGKWQQTWVDNQGGYLDFIGAFKDGQMVLERKAIADGKEIYQRMVWYNIAKDNFDWNWERADDEGKTWKILWKIIYSRKK